MIKLTKLLFVTLAIALSGCAATVTRPTLSQAPVFASSVTPKTIAVVITGSSTIKASSDWNTFCAEWRSALTSAAAAAGLDLDRAAGGPPHLGFFRRAAAGQLAGGAG